MNINELSKFVWEKSEFINFGNTPEWNPNLFSKDWTELPQLNKWQKIIDNAGWYWFLVNMNYEEIHQLERPSTLPDSCCDIGLLTHDNQETFGDSLLCSPLEDMLVVYNGHAAKIDKRLRQHFLGSKGTGAIGLNHYQLISSKQWQVKFFSLAHIPLDISPENRSKLELLINAKSGTGRCAVETAWRVNYGWPVLCKT